MLSVLSFRTLSVSPCWIYSRLYIRKFPIFLSLISFLSDIYFHSYQKIRCFSSAKSIYTYYGTKYHETNSSADESSANWALKVVVWIGIAVGIHVKSPSANTHTNEENAEAPYYGFCIQCIHQSPLARAD
jgi:hypothetical protein